MSCLCCFDIDSHDISEKEHHNLDFSYFIFVIVTSQVILDLYPNIWVCF